MILCKMPRAQCKGFTLTNTVPFIIYKFLKTTFALCSVQCDEVKVKVPVYSLISMFASMFNRLFTPWHGAATGAQPAHVGPTLDLCTRYPSLLGEQKYCRMRSLPKAPTHDQCPESNPRLIDLRSFALPTGPRDQI